MSIAVVLTGSNGNLHTLKITMVKVKKALLFRDNMLHCLGTSHIILDYQILREIRFRNQECGGSINMHTYVVKRKLFSNDIKQRLPFILCRERVPAPRNEADEQDNDVERRTAASVATTLHSPPSDGQGDGPNSNSSNRNLLKSASISASKCIGVQPKTDAEVTNFIFY